MSDFEYLSVLISIVLGLGITNILGGLAGIVRQRHRLKIYAPVPITLVTLFLIHVQTWWTLFGLRGMRRWTIVEFLVVLIQPVFLYLASAMLVPDLAGNEVVDLRTDYHRERRWFFGIMLLLVLCSLARPVILSGQLTGAADLVGHAVFLAAIAVGFVSANDRVHNIVAPFMLAFFIAYVATLFVRLN